MCEYVCVPCYARDVTDDDTQYKHHLVALLHIGIWAVRNVIWERIVCLAFGMRAWQWEAMRITINPSGSDRIPTEFWSHLDTELNPFSLCVRHIHSLIDVNEIAILSYVIIQSIQFFLANLCFAQWNFVIISKAIFLYQIVIV